MNAEFLGALLHSQLRLPYSVIDGTDAQRTLALTGRGMLLSEELNNTRRLAYVPPIVITVNKTACSRQPYRLNDKAWNDKASTSGLSLLSVFMVHLDNLYAEPSFINFSLALELRRTRD